jgi:hypothetical protein
MKTIRFGVLVIIPSLLLACAIGLTNAKEPDANHMPEKAPSLYLRAQHNTPVDIQHTLGSKPVAGKPLDIQFTFIPEVALESIVVQFGGDKALNLDPAKNQFTYVGYGVGQTITQSLRVVPPSDGVFYVNIFITSSIHGHKRVKTSSVPIVVGNADRKSSLRANGKAVQDEKGQRFTVMQANETIEEEKKDKKQ